MSYTQRSGRSMATTQSQRTSKRSRVAASKKPRSTSKFVISRGLGFPRSGIPEQMKMTCRYVDNQILTFSSNIIYNVFSANGLFDPRTGTGGHQPYFFDQMMGLYNHYYVVASRCKFTITSSTLVDHAIGTVGFVDDDALFDTSATPGWLTNAERPDAVVRTTQLAVDVSFPIYLKWSYKPAFGSSILANDELRGNAASNPNEQAYFCMHSLDFSASPTNSMSVLAEIEYDTIFTERKTQGQS